MGNVHAYRGRLAPAVIVMALIALAVVALGMVAGPANATSTFTTCSSCHNYAFNDAFHQRSTHAAQTCAKCHVNGPGAAGLVPKACASCHGAANILARPTHTANKCGTTPGCHGVPKPTPTPTPTPTATPVATTMTLKAVPSIVKVRKSMKATGTAGPAASLKGAKVAFKVQRKVGTKWVKMKTGSTTVTATGTFAWKYKTVKKGVHRVTASIAKTSTYTAKKMVKKFRVK